MKCHFLKEKEYENIHDIDILDLREFILLLGSVDDLIDEDGELFDINSIQYDVHEHALRFYLARQRYQ